PRTPRSTNDLAMVACLKDHAYLGLRISGRRQPYKPLAGHQSLTTIHKTVRDSSVPIQIRNGVLSTVRIAVTQPCDVRGGCSGVDLKEVAVGVSLPEVKDFRPTCQHLSKSLVANQCERLSRLQCQWDSVSCREHV